MMKVTLAIPAYNRTEETAYLLQSVLNADAFPDEVLVCEDASPERAGIRAMVEGFRERFNGAGIKLTYHENEENLGYDKNLRNLIRRASGDWVLMMGNDDCLLKPGVGPLRHFLGKETRVRFLSCAYEQFHGSDGQTLHVNRYFPEDAVEKTRSGFIFKLASFISGVCVHREWAMDLETDAFDGGLFYQVYLSACAFAGEGLGYVVTPIIGGRRGGTPLFGTAASEKHLHTPGSISANSRFNMYASVMAIAAHVDRLHKTDIETGLREELDSRQIFHVYEGFAGRPRREVKELYDRMRELGLGKSLTHRALFGAAYFGGPIAPYLFRLARKIRDAL
ncbi:MAG: hypothetical protein JWO30_2100 [Fibrobacteres bacterium]|nr:hypothetical protein [Fibrobacterota bacterium]